MVLLASAVQGHTRQLAKHNEVWPMQSSTYECLLNDCPQILGHLVAGNKDKVKSTLTLLQSAVSKASGDPDLWELLAELSAASGDHPGECLNRDAVGASMWQHTGHMLIIGEADACRS